MPDLNVLYAGEATLEGTDAAEAPHVARPVREWEGGVEGKRLRDRTSIPSTRCEKLKFTYFVEVGNNPNVTY